MVNIDDLFPSGSNTSSDAPPSEQEQNNPASEGTLQSFKKLSNVFNDSKELTSNDKEYFKNLLSAAGNAGTHFKRLLKQYLSTEDPEERADTRARLIPAYWNMYNEIVESTEINNNHSSILFYRFGFVSEQLITQKQIAVLASVIKDRQINEPIYYLDEWFVLVAQEGVNATKGDEIAERRMNTEQRKEVKYRRLLGQVDHKRIVAERFSHELERLEEDLRSSLEIICAREPDPTNDNLKFAYSDTQSRSISQISKIISELSVLHRKYKSSRDDYVRVKQESIRQSGQWDPTQSQSYNNEGVLNEVQLIRQMAKLCVGRSGNHVPFLIESYYYGSRDDIATRENVNNVLAQLEYLDSGLFLRTFKEITTRIVPYIILIPCFGNMGICWEPFDRFERATSKGRVAIPMYPRNLRIAVIASMGDLRWQVAKEKAGRFWMEEGLTGWYYELFSRMKLKGDIRLNFIKDYILWMTKECEGTQKLNREVRGIFWRYVPFPQELKDKLRNQGYVYNELYKKDMNRAASSMY